MRLFIETLFPSEMYVDVGGFSVSVPTFVTYLFEWMFHIFFIAVCILWQRFGQPRVQDFSLNDPQISKKHYPNNQTAFPTVVLFLTSMLLPFFLSFTITYFNNQVHSKKQLYWNLHITSLSTLTANSLQLFVVSIFKNLVGKPRPDFISRCIPDYNILLPTPSRTTDVSICRNKAKGRLLQQGFQSFPCGHAAVTTTNFMMLFVLLAKNFKVFKSRDSLTEFVYGTPIFAIFLVNATSVSDHRHFMADVIAGDIIGLAASIASLCVYYKDSFILNETSYLKPFGPRRFFLNKVSEESLSARLNSEGIGEFIFDDDIEFTDINKSSEASKKNVFNSDRQQTIPSLKLSSFLNNMNE